MKRELLAFILLLQHLYSFAQTNISVTDPNICWEGVTETEVVSGGELRTWRFPKSYAEIDVSGYYTSKRAASSAGIVMKIKTASPALDVEFADDQTYTGQHFFYHNIAVFKNDVFQFTTNDYDIPLTNSGGTSVEWKFVMPVYTQMNLKSIELTSGYSLETIDCNNKPIYLAIGNSITMGVGVTQNGSHNTYSRLIADSEGYELYNWAIGGSKVYDGILDNLSSGIEPDLVTILWGYNDVHYSGNDNYFNNNTFPQYEAILDTICRKFPSAKVMAILPTYTTNPTNTAARTVPILSDGQLSIISDLMNTYSNLCYIDGWDYTDNSGLQDNVHLNDNGNASLASGVVSNLNTCGHYCTNANLGNDKTLCGVGSITLDCGLDGSGGRTFSWTLDGVTIGGASSGSYVASNAGTYEVIADSAGCIQTDQIYISGTLPTIDLGSDQDLCTQSQVTLDAGITGTGISYAWTKDGYPISGATNQTYNALEAGLFEVTVTATGCSPVSDDITISSGLLDVTHDTICTSGPANLFVSGNSTYDWYDAPTGGNFIATGNSITPNISSTTSYYVEDAAGVSTLVGIPEPDFTNNRAWNQNNWTFRNRFNVLTDLTIDSISVWPQVTGDVMIQILASDNSSVVATKSFSNAIGGIENRFATDFNLTPGTYYMDFTGTTVKLAYSNENDPQVSYPYTVADVITIDGAEPEWFQDEPRYAYSYNWRVTAGNTCNRTPVHAVIDANHTSCAGNTDCNGDMNGTASIDACGTCSGGNTGITPNSTCTDCNGDVNGTASVDACGTCSGGNTGITPNSTCTDCNGDANGTASVDACGICSGGNTGITPNSTCTDCNGDLNGTASVDACGICSGGNTGITPNSTCTDCNGDLNGTASVDACGTCSGGNTGIIPETDANNCITAIDGNAVGEITLYPNPTTCIIHLSQSAEWTLFDISGRKLMSGKSNKIDISIYKSGVYFIKTNDHMIKLSKE